MQLEGKDQADAELLALVMHKDASAESCLAALSAALKAPNCGALKSAADIVLERFAEDATVPLRFVEALLDTSKEKVTCKDSEILALEIVRRQKSLELFRKMDDSAKDQRKSMHELLWNHATLHIASKDYRTSVEFYTAALAYAEADAKAPIACQLAQAHLAVQKLQAERSLESPDTAAEDEARKALDKLRPLKDFWEELSGALTMMMTEAEKATAPTPVLLSIKEALRMLWEDTVAVPIPSKTGDAILVYLLIKLMKETEKGYDKIVAFSAAGGDRGAFSSASDWEDDDDGDGEDEDDSSSHGDGDGDGDEDDNDDFGSRLAALLSLAQKLGLAQQLGLAQDSWELLDDLSVNAVSSKDSIHDRLAAVFDQARERLAIVGKDAFFGVLPPRILAQSSGPAAATAHTADATHAAALMFRASGSFYDVISARTPEEEVRRVCFYVNATRNALLEYGRHPEDESTLSMLHDMHQKASAALEAATQLPAVNPEDLEMWHRIMCTTGKDLALRLPEYGHLMLEFIGRAKNGTGSEGRYNADTMIRVGHTCRVMPPAPLMDAAKAAWSAGLEILRSQDDPDMDLYAKAAKDLYEVSSEEEALTLLADISDFVRSMEALSYPSKHMKDLISTAWEQGCKQAEAGRRSKALAFMAAALNLMDFCNDYKNGKEEYNNLFAKTLGDAVQ